MTLQETAEAARKLFKLINNFELPVGAMAIHEGDLYTWSGEEWVMHVPLEKVSYAKNHGLCGNVTENTPDPFCCPAHRNEFIEDWCEVAWAGEEQDGTVKLYREALSFAVDGTLTVMYQDHDCLPSNVIPPFCCSVHRDNLLQQVEKSFDKAVGVIADSDKD